MREKHKDAVWATPTGWEMVGTNQFQAVGHCCGGFQKLGFSRYKRWTDSFLFFIDAKNSTFTGQVF